MCLCCYSLLNARVCVAGGVNSESNNPQGDVFKFSVSTGEWTFVAGSPTPESPTTEQGMGVPIAGNFSGPGFRVGASWFVRTKRNAAVPGSGEHGWWAQVAAVLSSCCLICFV